MQMHSSALNPVTFTRALTLLKRINKKVNASNIICSSYQNGTQSLTVFYQEDIEQYNFAAELNHTRDAEVLVTYKQSTTSRHSTEVEVKGLHNDEQKHNLS